MDADLDLLCISVYCTADDLLPERPRNARRRLSDAEVVTLCVAQVLMGIPSDRRFLRAARRQLGHLFPQLPSQDALHKRRAAAGRDDRVADRRVRRSAPRQRRRSRPARLDPGRVRPLRSRRAAARSWPMSAATATREATRAGFGGCDCTSPAHPTGRRAPRRWSLPTGPSARSRCSCCHAHSRGGETIVCDKGDAGREFAEAVSALGATIVRPAARDEPQTGPHLAPIRQRIESVFWTCKDLLSLERHGARTPRNLYARIAVRLLALAACIGLNHQLGRPSRAHRRLHRLTVASTI